MKWLVTGGAGFLGINLIRHLLARGDSVVSLDREPFDYPERSKITEIRGDIRVRADVERAAVGCDVVVHAAAALPLYPPDEIHTIDVDGTRTVIEATAPRRVVHISSTAVYGVPDHHPLVESGSDARRGAVQDREGRRGGGVRRGARRAGREVPILRPEVVRRPRAARRVRADVRVGARGPRLPDPRLGRQPVPAPRRGGPVHRDRARRHPARCAREPDLQPRRVRLHHPARGLPGRVRCRRAPAADPLAPRGPGDLGAARARAGEALAALSVDLRDGHRGLVRLHRQGPHQLGWTPAFSNKAALVRNFDWYCTNVDHLGAAGVTHRVPWKQGALALAKLAFPRRA